MSRYLIKDKSIDGDTFWFGEKMCNDGTLPFLWPNLSSFDTLNESSNFANEIELLHAMIEINLSKLFHASSCEPTPFLRVDGIYTIESTHSIVNFQFSYKAIFSLVAVK